MNESFRNSNTVANSSKNTSQRRSVFWLAVAFVALVIVPLNNIQAFDETNSFTLLVETIASVDEPAIHAALMQGMLSGLEGRRNVPAPKGWAELSAKLAKSDDQSVRDLANQLSQIFGDRAAVERSLATLKDSTAKLSERRKALRALLTQQNQEASQVLVALVDEPAMRLDAIRGFAMVENTAAPAVLLGRFGKMSPELRRAVVETLATRKPYAEALLIAVQKKVVSREEIPSHVARSLNTLLGESFVKVFGEVRAVARDREKLMVKYRKIITSESLASADASRGRAVFKKTCASCHLLYGDGGKIGPDLTGSNRANLDYLLLNSVDPSYDVPAGYRMVTIVTADGRAVNGVVAEEDGTRVVLKTVEQPRVVILKEDIELRKVSDKSMMPEGQLDKMKQQEVIDLVKYLRTTEQVEIAQ